MGENVFFGEYSKPGKSCESLIARFAYSNKESPILFLPTSASVFPVFLFVGFFAWRNMSDHPLQARSGKTVVAVGVGTLGVAACVAL